MKNPSDCQSENVLCALPAPVPARAREAKVTLPRSFAARVNQMAHRKGTQHAEMWRISTLGALQNMADEGVPLGELSVALAAIEADKDRSMPPSPSPSSCRCGQPN